MGIVGRLIGAIISTAIAYIMYIYLPPFILNFLDNSIAIGSANIDIGNVSQLVAFIIPANDDELTLFSEPEKNIPRINIAPGIKIPIKTPQILTIHPPIRQDQTDDDGAEYLEKMLATHQAAKAKLKEIHEEPIKKPQNATIPSQSNESEPIAESKPESETQPDEIIQAKKVKAEQKDQFLKGLKAFGDKFGKTLLKVSTTVGKGVLQVGATVGKGVAEIGEKVVGSIEERIVLNDEIDKELKQKHAEEAKKIPQFTFKYKDESTNPESNQSGYSLTEKEIIVLMDYEMSQAYASAKEFIELNQESMALHLFEFISQRAKEKSLVKVVEFIENKISRLYQ